MSPNAEYTTQPSYEEAPVAKQPMSKMNMNAQAPPTSQSEQTVDPLRLRGGCPGKFCGLPILPCRCDICIIPIPCC